MTNNMAQQTYGEWMRSNPPMPTLTAVDWLVQKYFNDYNVLIPELEYEQAKQMEKEQIMEANILGMQYVHCDENQWEEYAEQYYKEKYGNNTNQDI